MSCASRYALLFRGQSHHWGCSADVIDTSRFLQRLCVHSHHAMISEPLEQQGHCVDTFLALHSRCDVLAADLTDGELHGGRLRWSQNVHAQSKSQSSNFRHAINSFWLQAAARPTWQQYDYLIVTRYDVRLLSPIVPGWACHTASSRGSLAIASKCSAKTYASWRCTFDTLFIVPRAHWVDFNRSVGSADTPGSRSSRCCFNEMCMSGGVPATGQAFHHVFARRLEGGANNISFCFPPPDHGGTRSPNGPDYQCCSRGLTNWTKVYQAEVARDSTARLGGYVPANDSFGLATLSTRYMSQSL